MISTISVDNFFISQHLKNILSIPAKITIPNSIDVNYLNFLEIRLFLTTIL